MFKLIKRQHLDQVQNIYESLKYSLLIIQLNLFDHLQQMNTYNQNKYSPNRNRGPQLELESLSRVQFFSSTSSFYSQVESSEVMYGQKQIDQQTQLIFLSLQKDLDPKLSSEMRQKMEIIMNRAHILYNFTIPEQINAQQTLKIQTGQTIITCYARIKQLVQNYEKFMTNKMQFREFYSKYKNYQDSDNFKKDKKGGPSQKIHFQSIQKIQISKLTPIQKQTSNCYFPNNRLMNRTQSKNEQSQTTTVNPQTFIKVGSISDQIYKLKTYNKLLIQKVIILKKQLNEVKWDKERRILEERGNFHERIKRIISIKLDQFDQLQGAVGYKQGSLRSGQNQHAEKGMNFKQNIPVKFMRELEQNNSSLVKQISSNKKNIQRVMQAQHEIDRLTLENTNLKQQIERTSKLQTSRQLRLSEQDQMIDRQSQGNDGLRIITKRNQNLVSQTRILKGQLQNERQSNYKKKLSQNHHKQAQFSRMKQQITRKNSQILSLQFQLDQVKTKVSVLEQRLNKSQSSSRKMKLKSQQQEQMISSARQQHLAYSKKLYKSGESFYRSGSQQYFVSSFQKDENIRSQEKLNQPKIKITPYLSDVLEGFVYYKCLQKQFRYRYRRACLKQKQLLYKKDGFQVGVICRNGLQVSGKSQFDVTIFMTNCSSQTLSNIALSIINSNANNLVNLRSPTKKYSLKPGDQIKVDLDFQIFHYPVGSIVLCFQGLKDQIRLLLPANILKMFKFKQTSPDKQNMLKCSQKMFFVCERKVYKSFQTLIQCLLGYHKKLQNLSTMSLHAQHNQTGTQVKICFQYNQSNDQMLIYYFKQSGSLQLADYLMKNLKLLIQKQKK